MNNKRILDSCDHDETSDINKIHKPPVEKKKKKTHSVVSEKKWTLSEKQRFINGLGRSNLRKKDGNVNWKSLALFIGTRSTTEVKNFAKYFNSIESGNIYPEFHTKAAVDVWKDLAESSTIPGDNTANESVPQVFTVAALEPVPATSCAQPPNYGNIYTYLSSVLRGDVTTPQLPADDAIIVLDLLEDLISTLSNSETLLQRDFMHQRYAELRSNLISSTNEGATALTAVKYGSTNPFGIPINVLEFKEAVTGANRKE